MDSYLNKTLAGRYVIQEIIGVGGMARVYKAYDAVDNRIVAVKILKDEFLANEDFLLRFKNESKAISVLSHPNIVKVYDFSFEDDLQFIVMEHVEGITLKEYIETHGRVDWKESVHYVIQLLRALQHAHDKGIIHRDIKPQNILLLQNSVIKVTDFGIARFNRGELKNNTEEGAIGSVHYVSPEQARGEFTDERADIYSVGVVLYEMLTGVLPFNSEDAVSVALMQIQKDAERPTKINPSIPLGLEQITLRAMRKNPRERYQTAAEFLADLDEFRKNPQIKFDYSYFIDDKPTKNIASVSAQLNEKSILIDPAKRIQEQPVEVDDNQDAVGEEYAEDEAEAVNKGGFMTVSMLTGIAVTLVLVIVFVFFFSLRSTFSNLIKEKYSDTWAYSVLERIGIFSDEIIEVPNFLNMTREDIEEQYPNLKYDFSYVLNNNYNENRVCEQSPEAGSKVSSDTVIALSIASSTSAQIPESIIGISFETASSILKNRGFEVVCEAEYAESKTNGEVIRTYPEAGTIQAYRSTVIIYYASPLNDGMTQIPPLVGSKLSVAQDALDNLGIKYKVTYEDSTPENKDCVVRQDPVSQSVVNESTIVTLYVGNGVQQSNSATINFTLPNTGTAQTIKVFLNDVSYSVFSNVLCDGSSYSVSITGTGVDNVFEIVCNSSVLISGKIDFTAEVPAVSYVNENTTAAETTIHNSTDNEANSVEYVPPVAGMEKSAAITILNEAGFHNIRVENEASSVVRAGYIISQHPSGVPQRLGATITIYVSSGAPVEDTTASTTVPHEATTEAPVEATTERPEVTTKDTTATDVENTTAVVVEEIIE